MTKKHKIFEYLDFMAQMVPAPFYWMDLKGRFLGGNEAGVRAIGASSREDIIGKNVLEVYKDEEVANALQKDIDAVIRTGNSSQLEDKIIDVTTGKSKYFSATRMPLYDEIGKIIGIVGASIEITAEKEAEQLKIENARLALENVQMELEQQQIKAAEQARFNRDSSQLVHDIQSPLSSLSTVTQYANDLPEHLRIVIREAVNSISDIANNLLNIYKNPEALDKIPQPMLVSTALFEVLSNKRYEYKDLNVQFETNFDLDTSFAFIRILPGDFKRMLSNLINNAVDALDNKPDGKVTLELSNDSEWVIIAIEDNGKGMTKELEDKIRNNMQQSHGKENGHGIGLGQVHDTINQNAGKFDIYSTPNKGTSIIVKFPKIRTPQWIAEEIKIIKDDTIVIIDDDPSIHSAWDARLVQVLEKLPTLQVKHFLIGSEAINFINALTAEEKKHICLLTDYELLNQDLNGLDIIEQTGIKRSTLVTSHYAKAEIQNLGTNLHTKILPKELAYAVSIKIDKKIKPGSRKVDMVWIDDQPGFIDSIIKQHYSHLTIDRYEEPLTFMEDVAQYPLNTRIILDLYYNKAGIYNIDGFTVARQLHEIGYSNLYLLAGEEISSDKIPEFLTVILKNDTLGLSRLDKN